MFGTAGSLVNFKSVQTYFSATNPGFHEGRKGVRKPRFMIIEEEMQMGVAFKEMEGFDAAISSLIFTVLLE